jgi:predicted transcriptional regulator
MSASTTMTIRLATDTKEKLEQIAADTRRSKSFLASEAVAAYVDRELQIIKGIKTGLDDAAAGRVVPHDEAVAEMRAVIAEAKQRKAERG